MNWTIAGHKKQTDFLSQAISKGRLAHAYIFSGTEVLAQKQIARNFAQILLCQESRGCNNCAQCKTLLASSNPDYIEISGQEGIKIENIRDLAYKLSLKPYMAKYKVAVIDQAQTMTVEASNALLKLFEEPKSYTVIILITPNSALLLKTISSRGQKVNFGSSQSAYGSDTETEEKLKVFLGQSVSDKIKLINELSGQETKDLKTVLNAWLPALQSNLRNSASSMVAEHLRKLMTAIEMLDRNVNSKLVLTNLIINTIA